MKRVNQIWKNEKYRECLRSIEECEKHREFCRHTPEHFLAVARLAYLLALEAQIPSDRELIYAAGLLHDIGRHLQYREGIPHEEASAKLAEEILADCGFSREESRQIREAILAHRTKQEGGGLPALLYRADKLSRSCFCCPVLERCDWPADKKNMEIWY